MILVRHAKSLVDPTLPPAEWELTPEGQAAAAELGKTLRGRTVVASTERKAIFTAAALGLGEATISGAFCEVARPFYDGAGVLQTHVAEWFAGETVAGWETRSDAVARFAGGIASYDTDDLIVVTHGTVMTAWLWSIGAVEEPLAFWSDLRMPDAWGLDGGLQRYPAA